MNAVLDCFVQCAPPPLTSRTNAIGLSNQLRTPQIACRIGPRALLSELSKPLVFVCDVTVRNAGKTFEALNQSATKPLDDFDTTWLVAADGTGDVATLFCKYSEYLNMGEASLHPKCGSFPKG